MELSGLIFVALALVWAVVLLPKALRHHDEVAQTRSVDDLSGGARVLARREAVSEREARLVINPIPPAAVPLVTAIATSLDATTTAPVPRERAAARITAQRKASAAAAAKRRRILALLVLVSLVVGTVAGLGRLPLWAIAVPVSLTLVFLVTARVTVRREHARFDAEMRALRSRPSETRAAPADQETVAPVSSTVAPEVPAQVVPEQREPRPVLVSGLDDTSSFPVGLLDDVVATTDPGSLWDPLPVTLPTYVGKPRAHRSVRTIDLQAPGVASSGHDAASSALVADAATSAPPDDLPQRAVGS